MHMHAPHWSKAIRTNLIGLHCRVHCSVTAIYIVCYGNGIRSIKYYYMPFAMSQNLQWKLSKIGAICIAICTENGFCFMHCDCLG